MKPEPSPPPQPARRNRFADLRPADVTAIVNRVVRRDRVDDLPVAAFNSSI